MLDTYFQTGDVDTVKTVQQEKCGSYPLIKLCIKSGKRDKKFCINACKFDMCGLYVNIVLSFPGGGRLKVTLVASGKGGTGKTSLYGRCGRGVVAARPPRAPDRRRLRPPQSGYRARHVGQGGVFFADVAGGAVPLETGDGAASGL